MSLKTHKLDVPADKTACNFFTKICQRQKKSCRVWVFPRHVLLYWKNGASDSKKMENYRDLYEVEKQRYDEALQRCQEYHMDEVDIVSPHKWWKKTVAKTTTKASTKAGARKVTKTNAKGVEKAPRSGYHNFMREQFSKMTGDDPKTIVALYQENGRRLMKILQDYLDTQ